MRNIFLLLMLVLSLSTKAQVSDPDIMKSIHNIYAKYNDSCKIYEDLHLKKFKAKYKKSKLSLNEIISTDEDYNLAFKKYVKETSRFKDLKINDLENLIKEMEKTHPLLGKKIAAYPKEGETKETIKSFPLYKNLEVIMISQEEFDKISTEFTSASTPFIRKELMNTFPADLLDDPDEGIFRTKLIFMIDIDGSIKSVRAKGENNEFNLLGILTLCSITDKITPVKHNGENVIATFGVPLTLNFQ